MKWLSVAVQEEESAVSRDLCQEQLQLRKALPLLGAQACWVSVPVMFLYSRPALVKCTVLSIMGLILASPSQGSVMKFN